MTTEARARIDGHRLLREPTEQLVDARIRETNSEIQARGIVTQKRIIRRVAVHIAAFVFSFVFTAGVAVVGILLWVRPDSLLPLVLVSVFCSIVFVAVFSAIRMMILHHLFDEYPNKEEDPGLHHHWGKSVAYGLLALVVALLLTGLLVNIASAVTG